MKKTTTLHAMTFRTPIAKEYKTVIVYSTAIEPSYVAYKIASRLSQYLVTPLDLNVALSVSVRKHNIPIEKYGYAVIPLATLLIPRS